MFCLGILIANCFKLDNIADTMSAIGSIFAAIVASLALFTWREQIKFSDFYDNIKNLDATFQDLLKKCNNEIYGDYPNQIEYHLAISNYKFAWLNVEVFLSEKAKNSFKFKGNDIDRMLIDLKKSEMPEIALDDMLKKGMKAIKELKKISPTIL